jgi:forkhead transcription factor HCM1
MPSALNPLNPLNAPRRPLQSADSNVLFNPPPIASVGQSPFKASRTVSSPLTPVKASQAHHKLNLVPMAPPSTHSRPTDSLYKKQPFLSKFKTVAQKPSVNAAMNFGKENMHPTIFPAPPTINLSIDNYYPPKLAGKRALMEAAPIKETRPTKKPRLLEELELDPTRQNLPQLPPPSSLPQIHDDGTKPGHSYAQLIGMAILRSPNRRLTLAQIYKWISDTFKFYNPNDAGWQNSIRHNLSLHKAFIKIERPKDDPGKGNYWGIETGMEQQFMKDKPTRRSASTAENLPVMSTRLEPSKPTPAPMQEPTLPPPAPSMQMSLPPLPSSQATMSMALELSSDATIPVSDMVVPDEVSKELTDRDIALDSGLYSPLPAAMHSSPPIPRHVEARSGTPPPMTRPRGSSISRSHKRKFASMDDSGYISSLESSALRPHQKNAVLTSEADRPRIKRGRAEEEIARLRASSYDSPSKGRPWGAFPPSSSPIRQDSGQMLPPLTPAVKLRAPPRPPPSVSPNTNLRIHRDHVRHMLQSPLRRLTGAGDEAAIPWSPAFNLDDSVYAFNDMPSLDAADFDIFQDLDNFSGFGPMESPIKRSAKRVRLDRSHSANALTDITNSTSTKSTNSASFLKVPSQSNALLETPSRAFDGLPSPGKLFMQSPSKGASALLDVTADADWSVLAFDTGDFMTEEVEYSGLDILQGFEKIGSGQPMAKPAKSSKPGLGRSYSTAF